MGFIFILIETFTSPFLLFSIIFTDHSLSNS